MKSITLKHKITVYGIVLICWHLLSYSIFFLGINDRKIVLLTREDGVFETVGAILFLLSAILFLFLSFSKKNDKTLFTSNRIYFLLFGVVFLFAFLEEISWGQRLFNLRSPEWLQKINRQEELNIHNITIFHGVTEEGERKSFWALLLNFERIFSIFWFVYCFLLPLLHKFHYRARLIIERLNIPVVPVFIGVFFVLNYLLSEIINLYISSALHASVEIKECNFAFLFFIVSLWFVQKRNESISL